MEKLIQKSEKVTKLINRCNYRINAFGPSSLEIRIEPGGGISRKDWVWLRDNVLKPTGFKYCGQGQSTWYKVLYKKVKTGDKNHE